MIFRSETQRDIDTFNRYRMSLQGVNAMLPVNNREVGQPMSYLSKSGLAGLARLGQGDLVEVPPGTPVETGGAGDTSILSPGNISTIGTAVNSEIGWLTNLYRGYVGKPPLPASVSAPTVNVGISDDVRKIAVAAGVGLAVFLGIKLLRKG